MRFQAWLSKRGISKDILSKFSPKRGSGVSRQLKREDISYPSRLSFKAASLEQALHEIVRGVVEDLGYTGAMVATYDQGDVLPVRAFYINPKLASIDQISKWEESLSKSLGKPMSITDPRVAVVFRYKDEYSGNLSVKAANSGKLIVSDSLFDLFTPIIPPKLKPVVWSIQKILGISQVIAVPFFTDRGELVGNLFAARQENISKHDSKVLSAFARQAAAAIQGERLRLQIKVTNDLIFSIQTNLKNEEQIIHKISDGVVQELGYVCAAVATFEPEEQSFYLRLIQFSSDYATIEHIQIWERELSEIAQREVNISRPDEDHAKIFSDDALHADNLLLQAQRKGTPTITNHLNQLFEPLLPIACRPVIEKIQAQLGVQQIISIPIFSEGKEIVGNLIVGTRSKIFNLSELDLLNTFGQQAGAGIKNAQLYRVSEERRQVAQVFANMAFSATASVHALRNHIGFVRGHLQMLVSSEQSDTDIPPEIMREIVKHSPRMLARLGEASQVLSSLHEPWHIAPDSVADIHTCLVRAIDKSVPVADRVLDNEDKSSTGLRIYFDEANSIFPPIHTSPDMLKEAFEVVLKYCIDSIQSKNRVVFDTKVPGVKTTGTIWIECHKLTPSKVQILIRDDGIGMQPGHIGKIFAVSNLENQMASSFGLYWAKDYINQIGGRIEVKSIWKSGTTFRITLPTEKL